MIRLRSNAWFPTTKRKLAGMWKVPKLLTSQQHIVSCVCQQKRHASWNPVKGALNWLQEEQANAMVKRPNKALTRPLEHVAQGTASPFDDFAAAQGRLTPKRKIKHAVASEHKASTAKFRTSPRKLNDLSRLIARKPVDEAILQMEMSDKRPAKRILSMLAWARDLAETRGIRRERMIVDESWVAKGPKLKRLDVRGRMKHGVKTRRTARLNVVLREGPTKQEVQQKALDKELKHRLRASAMYGLWGAEPKAQNGGARRGILI